ncbi:MAG: GHKL domain-containing protein [Acidobacteria bacterium]|nr:GHKL domain-containing protein [Acidobacteriota bacterium]
MKSFLKYFAIIYIPIVLVLLWVFSYSAGRMMESGKNELLSEMRNMWQILAQYENSYHFSPAAHRRVQRISAKTTLRVTLIRPDGKVVDDSYLNPGGILKMENHSTRPEVAAAMLRGKGHSIRFSHTVKQEMMYYAERLPNNLVLRLAYPMTYVKQIQAAWRNHVVLSLIFLLIATGLISLYLAKRLAYPLRQLDEIVRQVESGEEDVHFPAFDDPTMSRISGLIYRIYHSMLRNQKKVMDERARLKQILSTMEESIILLDGENRVILFNQNVEKHLGARLNRGENVLDRISDMESLSLIRNILQSDEKYFPRLSRGGRFFEVYVREIKSDTLIVIHDITERGRYDVFKSELIGNITHELKTPMASIMGYAETLVENREIAREDADRFHRIILNQTRRLNDLIGDLLELHRLENTGQTVKVPEPVNWDDFAGELAARYRECGKKLRFNENDTSVFIRREHLESVLTNLIDNALKYSSGETVEIELNHSDETVILSVSDEGPVIPLGQRSRIFERFYTVSRSRNRERSGTGLGLSIVKHIATLYRGSVSLSENSRGGNTFTVVLVEEKEPLPRRRGAPEVPPR